jgi:Na+/H+-dicarboxylate symporter
MVIKIFISHSRLRVDLTESLAARLEGASIPLPDGTTAQLTVRWDRHLDPGRPLMDFTREIDEAAAVIVIWTEGAVDSRWVYAEAQRAWKQHKLVTVRAAGLDPALICVPFNTDNTCGVDDVPAILAAIQRIVASERSELAANRPATSRSSGPTPQIPQRVATLPSPRCKSGGHTKWGDVATAPRNFASLILVAMMLGILVGGACHEAFPEHQAAKIAGNISQVTDWFLVLIKIIVAPLVLSTLIVGITGHMGSGGALGRLGLKTMGWFISASLVALLLGMLMVNLLQPGVGLDLSIAGTGAVPNLGTLKEHNETLQILAFAILAGIAIASLTPHARIVEQAVELVAQIMREITSYVMMAAPLAVFAAIAATVTEKGLGILVISCTLIGEFYLSLVVLWLIIFAAGFLVVGPRVVRLADLLREPLLLAFSIASSEAAYQKTLDRLVQFGVPKPTARFVLPLGYSLNLVGSMMYCTFATLYIGQAYSVTLDLSQQLTMLLLLMLTSKGMPGMPGASLVVISATLSTFNIPQAGLLLIMGVDRFLDMGRSATNVVGHSIAAAAIARWEGVLRQEQSGLDEDAAANRDGDDAGTFDERTIALGVRRRAE